MIFSHWKGKVSVRTQQFRLDHRGNLYDMVLDPGQMRSINAKWPKIRRDLQTYVEKWKTDVGAGTDNVRPFSVGHRDFGLTQLPARDGQAFGSIERSASAHSYSALKQRYRVPGEEREGADPNDGIQARQTLCFASRNRKECFSARLSTLLRHTPGRCRS